MKKTDNTVILSAMRTPIGSFNGYFRQTPAVELGAKAVSGACAQADIDPKKVDEVYFGCVLPAALGQAPARQVALNAGLERHATCTTINKVCGSGMQSIILGERVLRLGERNLVIAGGMENMTRAPYLLPNARFGYRMGQGEIFDHMMLDGLEDAYTHRAPMGRFAEQCAQKFNLTREAQDDYALTSLERCKAATEAGLFQDEIIPIEIQEKKCTLTVGIDEGLNTAKPEKIPLLKPAFGENGTITAANASSIADGAAALVLSRASTAKKLGVTPLADIVGHFSFAQDPSWFTTAPIGAIEGLLKQLNWTVDDVDLFEINEAFAVVVLATMKALTLPLDRVNVHGGACVMGHPIGASGARIVVTLVHALRQRKLKRGIAALCIGGGEATAIAIEVHG